MGVCFNCGETSYDGMDGGRGEEVWYIYCYLYPDCEKELDK